MPSLKIFAPVIASTLLVLGGCAATTSTSTVEEAAVNAAETEAQAVALTELYEVHKDGRIYSFYDRALYKEFLEMGHTAYMFNRIGAGPNGETMVYGLTGADKKKRSGIPSVEMHDGKLQPEAFYGETVLDGRIYVFDSLQEMAAVRSHHEAAYRLTDIGAGPHGETVVYVLTSSNKKKRPEALIAKFKEMN